MGVGTAGLTRAQWTDLMGDPATGRVGLVTFEDLAPIRMVCYLLPAGDLMIPTGSNRELVHLACGRTVTIEFERLGSDGMVRRVRGHGVAAPISRRDRLPAVLSTVAALAMMAAFDSGIRVALDTITIDRSAVGQAPVGG